MGRRDQKLFEIPRGRVVSIFVKGNKFINAYMLHNGEKGFEHPVVEENQLNINCSEFSALNEAIREVISNGKSDVRLMVIYSNSLENIVNEIKGINDYEKLRGYLSDFKQLTHGMNYQVFYVRSRNSKASKSSDVSGEEEEFAQGAIDKLDSELSQVKKLKM